jgi:hypothetical protein
MSKSVHMEALGLTPESWARLTPAEQKEAARLHRGVMQTHHDIYISLLRGGLITEYEREDLELAQRREDSGEVKPLAEGMEVEILERLRNAENPSRDYSD